MGQPTFQLSEHSRNAYQSIIELKLEKGLLEVKEEKKRDPDNLLPVLLDNYADFLRLYFNEDPGDYEKFKLAWPRRLERMQQGPRQSPYRLFSLGVMHFQRAVIEVKWGNYWTAGVLFRKAYQQIRENQRRFPFFAPNHLYAGALEVAAGTIPEGYRWVGSMLGISGTIRGGLEQLENFLVRTDELSRLFHEEGLFYYAYLRFYVANDRTGTLSYLEQQQPDVIHNHLMTYLLTSLCMQSQQTERALTLIEGRNQLAGYLQTPIWELESAHAKLYRMDPAAEQLYLRFLTAFKGNSRVKDVLKRLSWWYYLQGNYGKAQECRKRILKTGKAVTDADKQALQEAQSSSWPDPLLLKARLLEDGGYFTASLQLLQNKKSSDFRPGRDQVEYTYRMGRLQDDLGRAAAAIPYYEQTFSQGKQLREHFAARAAWHLGVIFERRKELARAIQWYSQCLSLKDHDYKNSLDQLAKAGLLRCRER